MATLEKSRKELAGEYERVQKKAFTNWVNSHLIKAGQKIEDLYEDLKDGSKLLLLLELLTNEKLPREKGKMRFHKLQNVQNALDFLQKKRKIKLVNIRPDEIVDGNPKLILGLTWTLILHFQISGSLNLDEMAERPTSPQEISAKLIKEQLLEWAQRATDCYDEVSVTNFTSSWRDGMAFCAIIDRYRPDLLNFDDCDPETPLKNLERAFKTAEEELGIIRIVDPEDVCVPKPDDKAVMTYVSFLRHTFPDAPPPRKNRGPVVSIDDYKELHAITKKWIDEKRAAAQSREFPHSVEELEGLMVAMNKVKSKEMPTKKRDMKSLGELYGQLQELKAKKPSTPAIPSEMEYSKLEEDWTNLEKEVGECQQAMQDELERLKGLQSLAEKILSACDSHDASLAEIEKKVQQFEESSTTMDPQEATKMATELQQDIDALDKLVGDLRPGVQKLKDGQYHDVEKVEKRVEALSSKLRLLGPRLKEASSAVDEAQAVVAMETSLEELEVWLVSCGKFSNNQNIVSQIEEHKEFQLNKLAAVEQRMSRIANSPPPPGLEDKVTEVKARWERVVKQTKDRISGLEPIVDVVVEFDRVKNPLGEWCVQQQEYFENIPPLEVTPEQLLQQQTALEAVVADIHAHSDQVEKTEEVALKFIREAEPIQSLADRYARKLKSRDSISKAVKSRASEEEPDPSLTEQAAILQTQWEWLKNQATARADLIAKLLDKMNQFDRKYDALRKFVQESTELLEREKPVGQSAARIEEQMKTCQESRSEISEKQPAVDSMLSLGRSILAEPSTTSQNDALMQKLTGFIEDWSELQMAWQNWYNELHANMEQSKNLSDRLKNFEHDMRQLEPVCASLFPATVAMETLDDELKEIQVKFDSEVVQVYEEQKSTYETLKGSVSLLPDVTAAQETFKKFETTSGVIESYKQELSAVVTDVCGWWGGCAAVKVWLEEAEKTLSAHTPLASSMDIVEQQKRNIEKLSSEVDEHRSEVERALKSLEELAKHEKLLNPAPIEAYKNKLKKRWDAVCQQVESRKELCSSGKDHLTSYADLSLPFTVWIKGAESHLPSDAKLPKSKEQLQKEKEELDEFVAEVKVHGDDLDRLEAKGSDFLGCAKTYQSKLVEFNQRVGKDEGATLPEHYVDPSVEDFSSDAPLEPPTFDGEEYHNGIRVVAGNSLSLRKRYDALHAAARQRKELVDEAVTRRQDFDRALDNFLLPLGELEGRCDGLQDKGESKPAHIQERVETIRSLEVECMALEPKLHEVKASYDLLIDLRDGESVWEREGEDEALTGKEEAEKRYQDLLNKLHTKKELLNAELSNAQAFHGAFEDFVTWLRETERKIQRDDPLKLEDGELKLGLKYLKAIAGDISAHKPVYEGMCVKCQELMEHGVEDSEELQQRLDNAQQRWNAIQIVNDDIEAIEETIPKLEAFYSSYNEISAKVDDLLKKMETFSVSAISSDGLEAKNKELQELEETVNQRRSKLEALLASCDLLETPFDQSQFEKNVSELQEKMTQCDQVAAGKKADLKALGRKVHPMEDLFRQFRAWLESTNGTLDKLSPAATDQAEREQQLQKAKAVIKDVESHKEALNKLGAAVKVVTDLVDESDQKALKDELNEVTGQYNTLKFNSEGYPVQRWLEDRETQLCSLAPTGVLVAPVQGQIHEAQEFQRIVSSYKPELDLLSQFATEAQPSEGEGPVSSKMAEIQQNYDRLKALIDERRSMLESFMPSVQQYNSSRGAWEDLLCGWEGKSAALPPLAASPKFIQEQIDDIKALQQAIIDHEPEFVSLKKGAQKLCEGPSEEVEHFKHISQVQERQDLARPGQEQQQETLADYEVRLEALKQKFSEAAADLSTQLEKGNKFQDGMAGLSDWLSGLEGDMDGLKVHDPKSAVIEAQQGRCQEMMEQLEAKSAEKDTLVNLLVDLVAQLPTESEEREDLQSQVEELNKRWSALSEGLSQHESNLEAAFMLAKGHEGAMAKLLPWVPETTERLENLGPPPSEPELVEKLKTEIEGLKAEFNTLAPVCAACVENGQSLAEKCEAGQPKVTLEGDISDLQAKWEKLEKLFGDLLLKLTEALVQTQEFQGIAKGLERWMEGMNDALHQQERIAARVKLIEPQIEGFGPMLSDISAYSSTVDQAKAMGRTLISESDTEEKQKIEARLEALESEFAKLQTAAQGRMSRLEDALKRATVYEGSCGDFDKWLLDIEAKLSKMEPFSVASQPLKRQLEQAQEFVQQVESHKSEIEGVTKSELDLFDTEFSSVQLCEEHIVKSSRSAEKPVLPDWLERPGAPEVIEVGADLRDRYDKLKLAAGSKCDEASQLMEKVLAYEEEYDKFSGWLQEEKANIASFALPAITVDEVKVQLEETENCQRSFKNQEQALESVDTKGTALVNVCKDELSQTSARIKLSDLNESWGDALTTLSAREEKLRQGLALAQNYQKLHDDFNSWLSGCETRVKEPPTTEGDPQQIRKELEELRALSQEISGHKSNLDSTVEAGRELEAYTDAEPSSLPDIGYTDLQRRYDVLKASVGERISSLEQTLDDVSSLHGDLNDLLEKLKDMQSKLKGHEPPRVLPAHAEKQLKRLSSVENSYAELQPQISKAKQDGTVFTSANGVTDSLPSEDVPSGCEIQQLLADIEQANTEVGDLTGYWRDLLSASLETAKKFEADQSSLAGWMKTRGGELTAADTVRGVPDGVQEQLEQLKTIQEDISSHQASLDALGGLARSITANCSPDDCSVIEGKLKQCSSGYEDLIRSANARKRVLDDGLVQATNFATDWSDTMAVVTAKHSELEQLSPVGVDIDTVKTQLEEYKELESSLFPIKSKIAEVQSQGKQLKDSCSSQDGPFIKEQLEKLNASWSQLYSDSLGRKHQLEDALLQLGQFHDALAELLEWIANCKNRLTNARPPKVKIRGIEAQTNDLENIESGISSHAASVASLTAAGEKLITSSSAENTAEIQQDLSDLNEQWESLKAQAAGRRGTLEEALERAKNYNEHWKSLIDWLADAERRAYADWKPSALPETCQADITKHQSFMTEVHSHKDPIEALNAEGSELKTRASSEDQRMVDRMLGDVRKRYEDLDFTLEEKKAQLQDALERANQFDQLYTNLHNLLRKAEEAESRQEPIHSEVEAVKQQMEDHKEVMKGLAELETQLDDLDGWGQLLIKDCVEPDGEVVQQRVNELRSRWDALNSSSIARLSSLEESLLSLGQFEEAYDELWAWLTDALQQLENTEPITGDPDAVATQLAKHKALQKQLGSRHSSKNAVSRTGKLLMKHKTGDDRVVLKKKLQDLEREWEKVCQMSVARQDKLENAYRKIGQFRSTLGPLRSWMAKVSPSLNESEPVHGDLDTVESMAAAHSAFQKDLGTHQKSVDAANAGGEHLISDVLDDPAVTQQDLQELNEAWENICQLSVRKQERLDEALKDARKFEEGFADLVIWIDAQSSELQNQLPPDEDASVLQQQIEDHKALTQEVTARQPQYDTVNGDGQNLLQLAHPAAVPVLQGKLHHLGKKWTDLRKRIGARSEALASALLELHGLQDMLDKLRAWVVEAEDRMSQTEALPISNNIEDLEQQLASHEAFQEEMATQQPNMDALNKTAKKQKTNNPNANPEMAKRISSLYKHWQKLWFRSSERHRQLLEARTRLKDIALARSFNFDNWRKRFNGWVDQQKLRVNDLFRRFDGNHDGMLTREEFMKALRASGLAMNQIELEKIADFFDKDRSGVIDLSEILRVIKGSKRGKYVVQEAMSDSEKIENEIQFQVSKCTCSKKFCVTRVAEGQYRFGDSQKLRLVRILRSVVMVRVGGGWESLEEFLRKHDPCRASGRTNQALRGLLTGSKKPGLITQEFTTKRQTATAAKNAALRREAGEDSKSRMASRAYAHGRKDTTVTTTAKTSRGSRETTPNHEHDKYCPHHHQKAHTPPRSSPGSSGRSTPQGQGRNSNPTTPVRKANRVQASTSRTSLVSPRHTAATSASSRTGSSGVEAAGGRGLTGTPAKRKAGAAAGGSTPRTGTGEAVGTKRPTTPSGTSGLRVGTGVGVQKGSRIPTPAKSKIPTKQS